MIPRFEKEKGEARNETKKQKNACKTAQAGLGKSATERQEDEGAANQIRWRGRSDTGQEKEGVND